MNGNAAKTMEHAARCQLSEFAPANARAYAEALACDYRRRRACEIVRGMLPALATRDDAVAELTTKLQTIDRSTSGRWVQRADAVLADVAEEIDRRTESKGGVTGVATGFAEIDRLTTGLHPGQLVVLGARPSVGKTAILVNVAEHVAITNGVPVGLISLEQSRAELVTRMVAGQGSVGLHALRSGELESDDYARMTAGMARIKDAPLHIMDRPGAGMDRIESQARRWVRADGARLLVIDYLQKVGGRDKRLPQHEQIAETAAALKDLGRVLGVPVLVGAQLGRDCEKRPDKRPRLSDLRGSGDIEQEADVVLLLYREEMYEPNTRRAGLADVVVAKNRDGPVGGVVTLEFKGRYARFENYETGAKR
jgi:replicative DNA helicase